MRRLVFFAAELLVSLTALAWVQPNTYALDLVLDTPVPVSAPFEQDAPQVNFASGFVFPIYGQVLDSVYVGYDGTIGLTSSAVGTGFDDTQFLLPPSKIAGAYGSFTGTDLGGSITAIQSSDNVLFQYRNIAGTQTDNSWDVQLFNDGRIAYSYLGINEPNFIIGLSLESQGATEILNFETSSGTTGTQPTLYSIISNGGTGSVSPIINPFTLNGDTLVFTPVDPTSPTASYSWQAQPIPEPVVDGLLFWSMPLVGLSWMKRRRLKA